MIHGIDVTMLVRFSMCNRVVHDRGTVSSENETSKKYVYRNFKDA
jgi:hypothetical protein